MTLEEADALLTTYLAEHWTQTPIAWQNIEPRNFSEMGQPLLPSGTEDFIAVRSEIVNNQTLTVPGRCIRTQMQLQVAVCVKENTGTRSARRWLSDLVALLENQRIGDPGSQLSFGTLSGAARYVTDNGWFVEEASLPCYFERHVALT
jgi:hypothetical protein